MVSGNLNFNSTFEGYLTHCELQKVYVTQYEDPEIKTRYLFYRIKKLSPHSKRLHTYFFFNNSLTFNFALRRKLVQSETTGSIRKFKNFNLTYPWVGKNPIINGGSYYQSLVSLFEQKQTKQPFVTRVLKPRKGGFFVYKNGLVGYTPKESLSLGLKSFKSRNSELVKTYIRSCLSYESQRNTNPSWFLLLKNAVFTLKRPRITGKKRGKVVYGTKLLFFNKPITNTLDVQLKSLRRQYAVVKASEGQSNLTSSFHNVEVQANKKLANKTYSKGQLSAKGHKIK
jgi:hypothetical protein